MTIPKVGKPPVTLAEFRAHLNLDANTTASDEELWDAVLAATAQVEFACGPVRPRSEVDVVDSWGGCLLLPTFPVVSLTSVVPAGLYGGGPALDVSTLRLDPRTGEVSGSGSGCFGCFTVTYVVGYHPIPRALMQAVLILAKLEWATQRGPSAVNRFRGMGDTDAAGMSSGLDKYRADRIMDPYRLGRI